MNTFKILGVVLIAGVIMTFGSEIAERISLPGTQHLVPAAEAIVGRPLTPVSVAGVARRTVRRCAVGVYCRLPESQSLASLLDKTSSEASYFERRIQAIQMQGDKHMRRIKLHSRSSSALQWIA